MPSPPRTRRVLLPVALAVSLALVGAGCQDLLDSLNDAGVGSDGGGQGGSGGSAVHRGCGLTAEPEPNDTRTAATPYLAGSNATGCLAAAADVDFYETTAPAGNAAGGYYQGSIGNVGAGTIDLKIYTASDNSPLLQGAFTIDAGASLFFFFAAAPGQTYRLAVAPFNPFPGPFLYTLSAAYAPVTDRFEPNDTRDAAKAIRVGEAVDALFFAGHKSANVTREEFSDFYALDLAAGMASIKLERVPANVRPEVELFDGSGTSVAGGRMQNGTPGGSINVTTTVARGAHRLEVRIFTLAPDTAGKVMALPDNFMKPYRLTVSQP